MRVGLSMHMIQVTYEGASKSQNRHRDTVVSVFVLDEKLGITEKNRSCSPRLEPVCDHGNDAWMTVRLILLDVSAIL